MTEYQFYQNIGDQKFTLKNITKTNLIKTLRKFIKVWDDNRHSYESIREIERTREQVWRENRRKQY